MSELTLLVLRIGFLLLLWLFVFAVMYAMRSDLFGAPVRRMKTTEAAPAEANTAQISPAAPAPQPQTTPTEMPPPNAGTDGPPTQLVILSGVAAGSTIRLDDSTLTIGRSPDSTLVIVDEYTSTYHAKLERDGDAWSITDLDSTNGTKVAGRQIKAKVALPSFTKVTIGTTTFELRP